MILPIAEAGAGGGEKEEEGAVSPSHEGFHQGRHQGQANAKLPIYAFWHHSYSSQQVSQGVG